MYSNIRERLLSGDGTAYPEETAEGSQAQPVPSLPQPDVGVESISHEVASPGNGTMQPSKPDLDLGDVGNQLAAAINNGDRTALDDLLDLLEEKGIDPNLSDQQGCYPLFWFRDEYRLSYFLKTLLGRGVDPNIATIDPLTDEEYIPLLLAAKKGSYEISKALLDHGADPHVHDRAHWTALHFATSRPSFQTAMLLKCLLDHGANINARNDLGRTPLSNAVIREVLSAVNTLLSEGADPDIPDNEGSTALDHAVFNWHTNMVDDLLAHGANPDTPGGIHPYGWSNALCMAISKQHRDDIVDMLLAYGANPDKASKKGDTPLHLAIEKGNSTCVHKLLAHGANPNIRNQSGQTALEAAQAAKSPPRIINALSEPFKPVSLQICARKCIRADLMRPKMTLKKNRAKPLSLEVQRLGLPTFYKKFLSNPLTY